jgi:hypothetical protein
MVWTKGGGRWAMMLEANPFVARDHQSEAQPCQG